MTREGTNPGWLDATAAGADRSLQQDMPLLQMTAGEAGDPIWEQPSPPPEGPAQGAPREEYVPCGRLIELTRPRPRQARPPQQSS